MTPETKAQIDAIANVAFGVAKGPAPLTKWERDFINDLVSREARFGDKLAVSEKQAAIIARIAAEKTDYVAPKDTGIKTLADDRIYGSTSVYIKGSRPYVEGGLPEDYHGNLEWLPIDFRRSIEVGPAEPMDYTTTGAYERRPLSFQGRPAGEMVTRVDVLVIEFAAEMAAHVPA